MKKTILLLCILLGFATSVVAQKDVKDYGVLEVKNTAGENFVDLTLSYDIYSNCYNNIFIKAERDINIYFYIYLDDKLAYSGWAKMVAGQTYFLDDAFYDCKSSFKNVYVNTKARFE